MSRAKGKTKNLSACIPLPGKFKNPAPPLRRRFTPRLLDRRFRVLLRGKLLARHNALLRIENPQDAPNSKSVIRSSSGIACAANGICPSSHFGRRSFATSPPKKFFPRTHFRQAHSLLSIAFCAKQRASHPESAFILLRYVGGAAVQTPG